MFSLKGIALDSNYKNSLEEINIKKASGNSYLINLLFNNTYTEPLSIQKKTGNSYSIILPETRISSDNVKIIYKEGNGKDKIKLEIKEYPYLDQSINNGYVKVTATTIDNVSLKVASDIKLLQKSKTVDSKNIEIIKKEKPQNQTSIETTTEKINNENLPIPTKEIPKIDTGTNQVGAKIPAVKNKVNPDYLDILVKISLVLFILLLALRQMYKTFKKPVIKGQTKQNARKEIDEDSEELVTTQNRVKPKSQFDEEVERLSKQETTQSTINENNSIESEDFINEIMNENQNEEDDEYEDEDFDYDFDYDEEGEIEEIIDDSIPKLISTMPISKNKGFYLVKYDGSTALIGYIRDEIFVINKFDKIYNTNLQARLNERKKNKSNYLVRIDNYKALVEVSETNMKVLIEF